jgi:hypothetical protein
MVAPSLPGAGDDVPRQGLADAQAAADGVERLAGRVRGNDRGVAGLLGIGPLPACLPGAATRLAVLIEQAGDVRVRHAVLAGDVA